MNRLQNKRKKTFFCKTLDILNTYDLQIDQWISGVEWGGSIIRIKIDRVFL